LAGAVLLHLVRHGRPVIEPGKPASSWLLDRGAASDLQHLRVFLTANVRAASWHSSDEPKAVATASALTDREFDILPTLREALRADWFPHQREFQVAVLTAFGTPTRPGRPGWEPFERTRTRIAAAARQIVEQSPTDVVLVGHGTAWTLLVSEITGQPLDLDAWRRLQTPDLDAWRRLQMPDLCTLDLRTGSLVRPWGTWPSERPAVPDSAS
jgi:broad specificity phosphatase PhoE